MKRAYKVGQRIRIRDMRNERLQYAVKPCPSGLGSRGVERRELRRRVGNKVGYVVEVLQRKRDFVGYVSVRWGTVGTPDTTLAVFGEGGLEVMT